jgi:catechol 2,3-dioxygenase-like lactoylglutathione lyase family enzyme
MNILTKRPTSRAPKQLYFRDPDGILIQLERPAYISPGAQRVSPSQQASQPLFKAICLDHITLQVSGLERFTAFYAGLFGSVERGTKNNASVRMETGEGLTWTTTGPGTNPVGIDHFCIAIEGYEPDT